MPVPARESRLRVAVVSPHGIEPANSGDRARTSALCRGLQDQGVDAHLVYYSWSPEDAAPHGLPAVAVPGKPADRVGRVRWRAELAWRRRTDPWALTHMPAATSGLRRALQLVAADVVDFQHSFTWVPTAWPDVVTFHNVESRRRGPRASFGPASRPAVEEMERRVIAGARRCVVFSEDDAARLADVAGPGAPAPECVPLGYEPPAATRDPVRERLRTIAFVGWMAYEPNAEAVADLLARWPRLRGVGGVERLVVIGREAARRVHDVPAGVEVRSDVADVAAALADVDALVVPLRSGGGVRVKIVEALALGLPVLTTELGGEGLGLVDGRHAIVIPDNDGLGAGLERLADTGTRRLLAEEGRRLWEERFDPARMADRMLAVYRKVVATG